jgi:hypothetical protein
LPPRYLSFVQQHQVNGISIGYFNLWPPPKRVSSLSDSLISSHLDYASFRQVAQARDLVIVGSFEADLICIGSAKDREPDAVYMLEVDPGHALSAVANDFETLVILATNLHQITDSHADIDVAAAKMEGCCKTMGCNEEQARFWIGATRMAI